MAILYNNKSYLSWGNFIVNVFRVTHLLFKSVAWSSIVRLKISFKKLGNLNSHTIIFWIWSQINTENAIYVNFKDFLKNKVFISYTYFWFTEAVNSTSAIFTNLFYFLYCIASWGSWGWRNALSCSFTLLTAIFYGV